MKNLILLLRELEYETNPDLLNSCLPHLSQKIYNLLLKIKLCEDIYEAQDYFALLDLMQGLIMKLYFKKGVEIPDYLWRFARDFDRIDDEETQRYLFNEIKAGHYPLLKM